MISNIDWEITIKAPFKGLSPRYYRNAYSTYGDASQFNNLRNIDLSDLSCIKKGAGLKAFTVVNSDNSNTYESIVSIIDYEVSSKKTYAISATYIWELNWTTHTMTMIHKLPANSVGENLVVFGGNLYYAYNVLLSTVPVSSDIGKWDMSTTWTDTWGTTQVANPANIWKPGKHPMCVSDTFLVIGNGQYLGLYDGTNLFMNECDFKADATVDDIVTTEHQTYVAINRPSGAVIAIFNNDFSYIDTDGNPTVFSATDSKFIGGKIGALYANGGVVYLYDMTSSDDAFDVSYLNGSKATPLQSIAGTLPTYHERTWYKEFLTFCADANIVQVGQQDSSLNIISNFTNTLTGAVCISNPFGTLIIANTVGLYYEDGLATNSHAETLSFVCGQPFHNGMIEFIGVRTTKITGGTVTLTIKPNKSTTSTDWATIVINENGDLVDSSYYDKELNMEGLQDFKIEIDWDNTAHNIGIAEIYLKGKTY